MPTHQLRGPRIAMCKGGAMEFLDVLINFRPEKGRAVAATGTIGKRVVSLSIDEMRRVRSGKFSGHIAEGPVEGVLKWGSVSGTYGPEPIDLDISIDDQPHRLTGILNDDDIRIEFVRRYQAPYTVRSIGGAGGVVELALDPLEPMTLSGRVQRVVDALAAIIVAPTIIDRMGDFRVYPVTAV